MRSGLTLKKLFAPDSIQTPTVVVVEVVAEVTMAVAGAVTEEVMKREKDEDEDEDEDEDDGSDIFALGLIQLDESSKTQRNTNRTFTIVP